MTATLERLAAGEAITVALERLLDWQEYLFEQRDADVQHSAGSVDPVLGERFTEFQRAVQYVLDENVVHLLGGPTAYITALHPFEPRYSTAALIGDWPEWRREIWRRWMGRLRHRGVSEGMLFRHAYKLPFGEPLVLPETWRESTEFVSPETRELDLGHAAVIPLVHQTAYLGLLTIGFPASETRDLAIESVHRLAQWVLVPLLQPDSQAISERSLAEGVTRIYRPIMWRVRDTLVTYSAELNEKAQSLKKARESIGQRLTREGRVKVDAKLGDIQALMESAAVQLRFEGERGLSMIHGLAPDDAGSPFADSVGRTTAQEMRVIIEELIRVLANDDEGELDAIVRPNWVHFEAPTEFSLPLSRPQAQIVLEELLRNSFRAISQLFSLVARDPTMKDFSFTGPEAVERYVASRGQEPAVWILGEVGHGADGAHIVILRVRDNGIGMTREILARVLELGFSTKNEGTGTGLNIVRAITSLRGGRVRVDSSAAHDDTNALEIFSEVRLSF